MLVNKAVAAMFAAGAFALAGCAAGAGPAPTVRPLMVQVPVLHETPCPVPALADPALPLAGVGPESPPADTMRAYAAAVAILKGRGARARRSARRMRARGPTRARPSGERPMKFVSDCLTGKDNLTYDAGRVIGVLGALMYVAFWVVQVVATWRFTPGDADAYGRGLGMVLLAMAGALALKSHTEPERK